MLICVRKRRTMPSRRKRSSRRNPPSRPTSHLKPSPQSPSELKPPPPPPPQVSISPTPLCGCSRFLSNRRYRSRPPYNRCCISCFNSQRLDELESWDNILDEEMDRRLKEMDMMFEMLHISIDILNIEFRFEEIHRITGERLAALLKKKALVNPDKAEKAKALLQNEAVENLYDDEKECLTKKLQELRLKKQKLQTELDMIPKQSNLEFFCCDAIKKEKAKVVETDLEIRDDDDF